MSKNIKLVCGVGTNDANYQVATHISLQDTEGSVPKRRTVLCPYYQRWVSMLSRCYGNLSSIKSPTYIDCTVCEEWLTFSNFKSWMESQDWEGKQLDKDLLVEGNREYHPDKCIFISAVLNGFIADNVKSVGNYPPYVSATAQGKLTVRVKNPMTGKHEYLGVYPLTDVVSAYKRGRTRKLEIALLTFKEEGEVILSALRNMYKPLSDKEIRLKFNLVIEGED